MYAGPGLLRSGSTLSVNPNLKLQTLQIRDRIVVPNPLDVSEAANKRYVDEATSKSFYSVGNGLKIESDSRLISLQDDVTVKSLKLSGQISSDGSSVVTKSYVDNATKPLVSLSYVQDSLKNVVKTEDLKNATDSLASRVYVSTFMDRFATKDVLDEAVKPLARSDNVQTALNNKADISYVQNEVAGCVKKYSVIDILQPFAEKAFVEQSIANFISKDDVYKQIQTSADLINANISSTIDNAIQPLATKSYVDETARNAFSTTYVDKAIQPLATKAHVDNVVAKLAEEAYVDEAVSSLVSKTYVDDAVEQVTTKLSKYIDRTFSSASFPIIPIQHVVPDNDDTVEIDDDKTLLFINPKTSLDHLIISFPNDVEDGKYFIITTSKTIKEVKLENLVLASDTDQSKEYTAGSDKKFVYSAAAKAWVALS